MEKSYTFTEKNLRDKCDLALGMTLLRFSMMLMTRKDKPSSEEKEKEFEQMRKEFFDLLTMNHNE
jgi:hypothetical protein